MTPREHHLLQLMIWTLFWALMWVGAWTTLAMAYGWWAFALGWLCSGGAYNFKTNYDKLKTEIDA